MKFIGRQSELQTLEQEYRRDGGFVVIYGRRRVGKTRLIKEFIKDKPAVYFLATEEVEAQSMKRMAGVIARATGNALLGNVTFSDRAGRVSIHGQNKPGLPVHSAKYLG